tara:strand:+ start:26907 stop:27089 length:183 start_codon:yes stop_codon:yes gene_type:complete
MISNKIEKNLFYSWQSDSDERANKFLQRDILKTAMKAIRKSEPELAIRIESDATGLTGRL